MANTNRIVVVVALVLSVTTFLARPEACLACSCAIPPTPTDGWTAETLAQQADLVFRGSVIAAGTPTDLGGGLTDGRYTVLFAVDEVWSGVVRRYYRVTAGQGGGDCTIPFHLGDQWLIYGYGDPTTDQLVNTGICNRTKPNFGGQTGDVIILGRGTTPGLHDATTPAGAMPIVGRQMELIAHLVWLWR